MIIEHQSGTFPIAARRSLSLNGSLIAPLKRVDISLFEKALVDPNGAQ
jgi:hypothetical protein